MKNKIAKKLFFSAVALGASVLTLTTTTYAWYVQNNTVTVTNIQASTASNDAGSLFISKDARSTVTPQWGPTIASTSADFTGADGIAIGNGKEAFVPVTYDQDNSRFVDVTNTAVPANATNSAVPGKVLVYNFYLMSNRAAGVKVRPTLIVTNTTENKTPQTAYAAIKKNDNTNLVTEGSEFWVDAVQALRMRVTTTKMDNAATIANPSTDPDEVAANPTIANPNYGNYNIAGVDQFYDVMAIAKKPKASPSDETYPAYTLVTGSLAEGDFGTESVGGGSELKGAHAYYKRFVGDTPAAGWNAKFNLLPETLTTSGEMEILEIGTAPIKYTVTIWLEGTDVSCFDSCSGQTFNFGFDFTVKGNA